MKSPADISASIRRIAAKIDNSERPSASLIKKDLRNLACELSPYRRACRSIAAQIVLLAAGEDMDDATKKEFGDFINDKKHEKDVQEEMRSGLWDDFESGKELDTSWKSAKNADTESILTHALKTVADDANDFIREIKGEKTNRRKLREDDQGVVTSAPPMKK